MPRKRAREEDEDDDDDYEDGVDDFVGAVFEHPRVTGVINKVSRTLDSLAGLIDQVGRRPRGGPAEEHYDPPPHQRQQPPRQPPPRQTVRIDPYVVLGLPRNVPLTEAMLKDRRRQLAKIFHTDHGGNDEAMKRVNAATELLLQKIGAKKAP